MEKQQKPVPLRWPIVKKVVWMFGSLGAAVACAVGHHLFYQQLNGTTPPNTSYSVWGFSHHISRQQINISIGNTLAFFTKACLAIAVACAYDQISWRTIKRHPTELGLVDDLFSSMDDLLSALNVRMWRKMPTPTLLLLVFWLLPLVPLISPSTLTIQSVLLNDTVSMRTPRADFTSMNFASISQNFSAGEWPNFQMTYRGPQFSVQKSVQGSLMAGSILSITPPRLNSTWKLDFDGPALSCKTLNTSEEERQDIITSFENNLDLTEIQYLSWVPANGSGLPDDATSLRLATVGGSPLALYVMIPPPYSLPSISVTTDGSGSTSTASQSSLYNDTVSAYDRYLQSYYRNNTYLLQCTLQNVSYSSTFIYTNGVQDVKLNLSQPLNNVSYLKGFNASAAESAGTALNLSSVQTFAYQSVMDAFASMLVGSVKWASAMVDGQESTDSTFMATTDTSMATTVVLQAREMANVTQLLTSQSGLLGDVQWVGTSIDWNETGTRPMAELLEEMFLNATMSLMSIAALNPNYTSPFAPPNATVHMWTSRNVYQYAPSTLWVTYGAAIGLSALGVLVGAIVVLTERAAYSTCFSTLLRVSHNVYLPTRLKLRDTVGQDPLPEHLKSMVVSFPPGGRTMTNMSGKEVDRPP